MIDEAEKSKELVEQAALIKPKVWSAFWKKLGWRPNLVAMAADRNFLAQILSRAPNEWLQHASAAPNPFAAILEMVDPEKWSAFCEAENTPWLVNFWVALASWSLALWRLSERLHGRRDRYLKLQKAVRTGDNLLEKALDYFCASLGHMSREQRAEQIEKLPSCYHQMKRQLSESARRRLRKVTNQGLSVSTEPSKDRPLELFLVRFWLRIRVQDPTSSDVEFVPGLMFVSDPALASIVEHVRVLGPDMNKYYAGSPPATDATERFRLTAVEDTESISKVRQRLGLVQAGSRSHLIDAVRITASAASFQHGDEVVFSICSS